MNRIGYQFVRFFYSGTLFEQEINMKKLLLILMMIPFAGVNTTQAQWVHGAGATSCGRVISDTKGDSDSTLLYAYRFWMQGYISGLNYERVSIKGKGIDPAAIWYAVMNRCREKPLDIFAVATRWVYDNELTE